MTTRDRILTCLCIAGVLTFAFVKTAPPVEEFLGAHGWTQTSGAAEVCVVEDVTKRTSEIGSAIVAFGIAAAKKQIAWHVIPVTSTGPSVAEVQWAIDAAKGKTLPVICYRHGQGRATVKPLPATPQACVDLLNKI